MTGSTLRQTGLTTAALRREYDRLGELVRLVEAGRMAPDEVRAALWVAERLLASARAGLVKGPARKAAPGRR